MTVFNVGFWHVDGLRSKAGSKEFLDVLWDNDVFGTVGSLAGLEVYEVNGFIRYLKVRSRVTKFGRHAGRLLVYIRMGIGKRVTDIAMNMKEIIWVGVSKKRKTKIEICVGFVCNAS
jgi:hypothetical protein